MLVGVGERVVPEVAMCLERTRDVCLSTTGVVQGESESVLMGADGLAGIIDLSHPLSFCPTRCLMVDILVLPLL